MNFKNYLEERPALKQFVHGLIVHEARPRWWISWFVNPLVHKRHRTSAVRSTARLDVLPFRRFDMDEHSKVEDYCVVNNGVGDVTIGKSSLVGVGCVVIGPVAIGANVILAQHIVLSGLNHSYENIDLPIRQQPVVTKAIRVEDDCWIGANAVITAGVTIGKHSVVAGGSVVTRNVPPYTVVGGNPARILKQYDPESASWVSPQKTTVSLA
jgi:acetyltransferase-like isoleucine patch superfamily enzyme